MSNSERPQRRQPTRLLRHWDSPGKNTGVGCHFLLQCMKVKSENEVAQSCPTPSDPMDCSPPGSSVHGIFQARILEWGAIAQTDKVSPYVVGPFSLFFFYTIGQLLQRMERVASLISSLSYQISRLDGFLGVRRFADGGTEDRGRKRPARSRTAQGPRCLFLSGPHSSL